MRHGNARGSGERNMNVVEFGFLWGGLVIFSVFIIYKLKCIEEQLELLEKKVKEQ